MSECAKRESYLDQRLSDEESAQFEQHLPGCDACRTEVERWREIHGELAGWEDVDYQREPEPTPQQAHMLVERYRRKRQSPLALLRPLTLGAAAAAVAIVVIIGVSSLQERSKPTPGAVERADVVEIAWQQFEAPAEGHRVEQLGRHSLGLAQRSRMRVQEASEDSVVLHLLGGTAAFEVAPRTADQRFDVIAAAFRVAVTGTRFSVTRGDGGAVEVVVGEGAVGVMRQDGQQWNISAGQQLAAGPLGAPVIEKASMARIAVIGELLRRPETSGEPVADRAAEKAEGRGTEPKANPAVGAPSLDSSRHAAWRSLILDEKYAEAERVLRSHLEVAPQDFAAWTLLGDTQRKTGQYETAVNSYAKAAGSPNNREAGRARFVAATLLQEKLSDHTRAIELLEEYLRGSNSSGGMRAMAQVRLARSLLATGQTDRAQSVLKSVVAAEDPASIAAKNARQMLHSLK